MHTYWDDPKGELAQLEGVSADSFRRADSGVLFPHRKIDLEAIRLAQQEVLYPCFERLYRTACDALKNIDSLSQELGASVLQLNVLYRSPDYPAVRQELLCPTTGPVVALVENDKKLHPAVESVFPVTKTSDLPGEQQENLLREIRRKPGCAHLGLPDYIRTVQPKTAHLIMDWIANYEGLISDLTIAQRVEKISDKARNSAPHLN